MSTLEGTAEEIQPIYEEQLMKFKDIKEKAIEDYRKLLGEVKVKAEYCESVRKKCAEIAGEQYDLELKTGVGMIHSKTQRELTHDVSSSNLRECLKYTVIKPIYYRKIYIVLNSLKTFQSSILHPKMVKIN